MNPFTWPWLVAGSSAIVFGLLQICWGRIQGSISYVLASTYIESTHYEGDDTYEWLMTYWRNHLHFLRSRAFTVQAKPGVYGDPLGMGWEYPGRYGLYSERRSANKLKKADGSFVPIVSPREGASLWCFKLGTLLCLRRGTIVRAPQLGYGFPGQSQNRNFLQVRCYAFSRAPLFKFIQEARDLYEKTCPPMLSLYTLSVDGGHWDPSGWSRSSIKHKRKLESIIMDEGDKQRLLADATEPLDRELWYVQRGIPWRRGYMFEGCPGSGKSSTIMALASQLDLPIYTIPLASKEISDSKFASAMRSLPTGSIVVLEDIDVASAHAKRDLESPSVSEVPKETTSPVSPSSPSLSGGITLSALLNGIDGCDTAEGRILIMTSNDMAQLDPALMRPGRCDLIFHYRRATKAQAEALFKYFYKNEDEEVAAQSGLESEKAMSLHFSADINARAQMASEWKAHLLDYEFSIATLQGMLLMHKDDPQAAVTGMPAWVGRQREEQEAVDKASLV